ncbi:MAG: fibronectin type III domain-containing protein, partial [Thermoplasmata archaeon]|nr:fibronectin type III domain-containing protein [Thermoplasmata archaeon]NIS13744.1 fibronectin type III domain-containing protein [Thermoplasmata archaeon]
YECGRILDVEIWRGDTDEGPDGKVYINDVHVDTYYDKYSTRNGETGYYWVYVKNTAGRGKPTLVSGTPFGHPDEPAVLMATSGDGRVHLEWEPPPFWGGRTENLSYGLFRGDTEDSIDTLVKVLTADDDSYIDNESLALGEIYWYGLQARNIGYRSGLTKNSTLVYEPPGVPVVTNVTRGDKNITIRWDPPSSDGGSSITGYHFSSKIENGAWSKPILLDAQTHEYTWSNLLNGESHWFRLS